MKYIVKGREPDSLTQYRQLQGAYFDGYPQKDKLREALLKEQKYICCYCMQSISIDKIKIEHWLPQSDEDEGQQKQLDYSNLLVACLGNEGKSKHLQHCDSSKGNTIIKINPTLPVCEAMIKFKSNGEIYSDDAEISKDLNDTLNLNHQTMKNNRGKVLDSALKNLERKYKGKWSKDILQREIDKWENRNDDKYEAYCQIVIDYLKKKLAKL